MRARHSSLVVALGLVFSGGHIAYGQPNLPAPRNDRPTQPVLPSVCSLRPGTLVCNANLSLHQDDHPSLLLGANKTTWRLQGGSNFTLFEGAVARLIMLRGGHLGLGTSTPKSVLHLHAREPQLTLSDHVGAWQLWGGYDLHFRADAQTMLFISHDGNVGVGTSKPRARLAVAGKVQVLDTTGARVVVEIGEGLDFAEGFDVSPNQDPALNPGAVLRIDEQHPGKLTLSRTAYDTRVAGIVTGANGLGAGVALGGSRFDHGVALAGRVYCNVEAISAEIAPGDLLTTSDLPGHAMKAVDVQRARGAILGKAMEGMKRGETGRMLVLVTLQ